MPYYLVTQTQLLEADNPELAADKALNIIVRADRLSFSVKSDETTTTIVVVSKPAQNKPSSSEPVRPLSFDEPQVQDRLETSTDPGALDVSHKAVVMPAKNRVVWGVALLSVCVACGAIWYRFSS